MLAPCRAGRCVSWSPRPRCSTIRAATSTSAKPTGRRRSARLSPRPGPGLRNRRRSARVPINWKILADERMVIARADGPVTLQEIQDYLDAVVVAGAQPYAKLFDAGTMELK